MGAVNWLVLLLTHPLEFRVLLQYWLFHEQKRDIKAIQEHPTSGYDRASMRRCWDFLDMTSRSFSAVIKELEGDLARTIALFYLVLRGLDTIEDDMTLPDEVKQPILRAFHIHTVTPGWTFDKSGPQEKDRQLLVEYDNIVTEVNLLDPAYKAVILDICQKMQTGMADYAHKAATTGSIYLDTVAEYDLYCHYVAGLVGEGLSGIFAASGKERPEIGAQLELSNSMGLWLQKTNIIRDYREDVEQERYFWPKEIWGRYGFEEMKEMYDTSSEDVRRRAQYAQSGMILDALRHATDGLDYLKMLKNQSVFNFCAIPATMAIATLELCFMNPMMMQRNVKIRKAEAAQVLRLIMRSTNPREVGVIYREFARKIHAKADTRDPNFLGISVACGKIEAWCELNYPSFIRLPSSSGAAPTSIEDMLDPYDPRSKVVIAEDNMDKEMAKKKRVRDLRLKNGSGGGGDVDDGAAAPGRDVNQTQFMLFIMAAFGGILAMCGGVVWAVLKYTGDL